MLLFVCFVLLSFYPNYIFSMISPFSYSFYYVNTNEIPGELSRKLDIFTCENNMLLLKSNGFVFHWCLYNKENITWPLGDTKFLFSCWKNISRVIAVNEWNIFQHSKRIFVSLSGHVISSIYLVLVRKWAYMISPKVSICASWPEKYF